MNNQTNDPLLSVSNLSIDFETETGNLRAVEDISFTVNRGEILGIVGESGCGKTVTALSLMRLLPEPTGKISGGQIRFKEKQIVSASADEMHKIRGAEIGIVFQEPMTALNPVHSIGRQISETLITHKQMSNTEALVESINLLKKVGIPSPEVRVSEYPHQLSGGMRQRVLIAIGLACGPDLLIADEPTTALDVTIQAQILHLLKDLQQSEQMSVIFITHDLGVIAQICDKVMVMYGGKIAEFGSVEHVFKHPSHPYTNGLLNSIPRLEDTPRQPLKTIRGQVPSLEELGSGCRFENRCDERMDICKTVFPDSQNLSNNHSVYCHLYSDKQKP
ncbi:MAG: oligopeptide/dipeptide ABC transporter ATP-binding protein [Gammaproteobacteria bacterium]|jgi:oligopeptide/dipeptide ABC transporter ATP-binding protein